MKSSTTLAALLVVLVGAGTATADKSTRYLVAFDSSAQLSATEGLTSKHRGKLLYEIPEIGVAIATSADPEFPSQLADEPSVLSVVEDRTYRASGPRPKVFVGAGNDRRNEQEPRAHGGSPLVTDPTQGDLYPLQWNLRRIEAPAAWAEGHLGHPNVLVAVLGSGLDYTHRELSGKIDLGRSVSFVPEDDDRVQALFPGAHPIADLNFHATMAAGLIACNAERIGCVAPNASLVGVKVQDFQESTRIGDVVQGIVYAANIGADVINMSFHVTLDGADQGDRIRAFFLRLAIFYARLRGAAVFAESGVPGAVLGIDADADGLDIIAPAQTGAITVGATGPEDQWSRISNYGFTLLDISAPGGFLPFTGPPNIDTVALGPCSRFTQLPVLMTTCNQNTESAYITVGGAIPATALVSGVAALVDSIHRGALRGRKLERQLRRTSDDILDPGFDNFSGHGRINAHRAVNERP